MCDDPAARAVNESTGSTAARCMLLQVPIEIRLQIYRCLVNLDHGNLALSRSMTRCAFIAHRSTHILSLDKFWCFLNGRSDWSGLAKVVQGRPIPVTSSALWQCLQLNSQVRAELKSIDIIRNIVLAQFHVFTDIEAQHISLEFSVNLPSVISLVPCLDEDEAFRLHHYAAVMTKFMVKHMGDSMIDLQRCCQMQPVKPMVELNIVWKGKCRDTTSDSIDREHLSKQTEEEPGSDGVNILLHRFARQITHQLARASIAYGDCDLLHVHDFSAYDIKFDLTGDDVL